MVTVHLLTLALIGTALSLADSGCSLIQVNSGTCVTATTTTDHVDLTGTTTPPRTGGPGTPSTPQTPVDDCANPASTTCLRPIPAIVTAPVTLADIASFRPSGPRDSMEPDGWTVAGLHTNFFASGGRHIVDGVLLGSPAQVRFTPVYWSWSYGDGESAGYPFPGGTWAAQGIREFDPTPTSHVYAERGTYVIDLDVEYTAEYRYDGGSWVPVVGSLVLPANRLTITAGGARTVLVERECTRNPGGPGC